MDFEGVIEDVTGDVIEEAEGYAATLKEIEDSEASWTDADIEEAKSYLSTLKEIEDSDVDIKNKDKVK